MGRSTESMRRRRALLAKLRPTLCVSCLKNDARESLTNCGECAARSVASVLSARSIDTDDAS
jgi:hypothetical protein